MKKGLKLGMLAVAFLAAVTAVISTGKVSADQDASASNIVRVAIDQYNGGQNDCSGSDYIFDLAASSEVQTGTINTGRISCILGNRAQKAITLQLSGDLTLSDDETVFIPKENIRFGNGTWTNTPSDLGTAGQSGITAFGDTAKTLFNKNGNKIGDASGTNLTIDVTVPAGQPDGTYNGTLVLTF